MKNKLLASITAVAAILALLCVHVRAQPSGQWSINFSLPGGTANGFYSFIMPSLSSTVASPTNIQATWDYPLTANVSSNTATLSAVLSSPPTLVAGHTYGFMIDQTVNGTASGGFQEAMNGTANGTLNWNAFSISPGSNETVSFGNYATAIGTGNIGGTFITAGANIFHGAGTFTCNATGTFGPWAAQQAANATFTNITVGSDFRVWLEN